MRLTTWNVLHARSLVDDRVDLDRFASAVADLDADVLGLQEVDRAQPRSHTADLTAVAAEAMGATAHRFAPALVGTPDTWAAPGPDSGVVVGPADGVRPVDAARPVDDGDGPGYGVALLSRHPVESWRVVRVPPLPRPVPLLLGRPRRVVVVRDEPRVAIAARLATPDGPVTVATTHLSFVQGWNLVQLRHLVRELDDGQPLVVMGDLNTGPRRARTASGLESLAVGRTFPADRPRAQLDHVLGRGVEARDARVEHPPLSDHRALSTAVTLRSRRPATR